jgi:hypothetical protein
MSGGKASTHFKPRLASFKLTNKRDVSKIFVSYKRV